jgi:phosphoribosylformylglycinamidine synthase subunit PurQ / glutaminase
VKTVRALVLTGFGINCQEEMAAAYRLAGAEADIVHFNELLAGQAAIRGYDVINFPGGFSFGDDLGAGKALANKMRFCKLASGRTLLDEIADHVAAGGFVLGVCNGFQILVKSGLLPNVGGNFQQEVSLIVNDSGKFEDRWVHCVAAQPTRTPFLKNVDVVALPARHKEGKLVCRDDAIRDAIRQQGLCALRYCDAEGHVATEYPALPNGAEMSCAALTDPAGRVLGMMPHPEAYLAIYNHPDWARRREAAGGTEEGEGLRLFRNVVEHIRSTPP